jgi:hypothetical protein
MYISSHSVFNPLTLLASKFWGACKAHPRIAHIWYLISGYGYIWTVIPLVTEDVNRAFKS